MGVKAMRARLGAIAVTAIVALGGFATSDAAAQNQRLRGEIETIDGHLLTVKAHDGRLVKVRLADNPTINHAQVANLTELTPGTYVGVGAFAEGNEMKAAHVQIFAPNTNARQGHGAWNADPSGTMTNGLVSAVVVGQSASALKVSIADQSYDIKIGPDTPVIRTVAGDGSLLKRGAWISVTNASEKDGVLMARQVVVSDDRRYPAR